MIKPLLWVHIYCEMVPGTQALCNNSEISLSIKFILTLSQFIICRRCTFSAIRLFHLLNVQFSEIQYPHFRCDVVLIFFSTMSSPKDVVSDDKSHTNCDATYDPRSDATCDVKSDADCDSKSDATCDAPDDPRSDATYDMKSNADCDVKRDATSDAKRYATCDAKRDATFEAKRDANCDAKSDPVLSDTNKTQNVLRDDKTCSISNVKVCDVNCNRDAESFSVSVVEIDAKSEAKTDPVIDSKSDAIGDAKSDAISDDNNFGAKSLNLNERLASVREKLSAIERNGAKIERRQDNIDRLALKYLTRSG